MKKTIIIGILVILVAIVGFFTYYMLNSKTTFIIGKTEEQQVDLPYNIEDETQAQEDITPEQEIDVKPSDNLTKAIQDLEKQKQTVEKIQAEYKESDGNKAISQLSETLTTILCFRNQNWHLDEDAPNNLKNILTENFLNKFNENEGILQDLDWEKLNYVNFDIYTSKLDTEYEKESKTYKASYIVDIIMKNKRHYINDVVYKSGYCISNPQEIPFDASKLFDIIILTYGGRNKKEIINNVYVENETPNFLPTDEFLNNHPDNKILGNLSSDIYDIDWFDNQGFIYTTNEAYIKVKTLKDDSFYWNYYTVTWELDSNNQLSKVNYKLEKSLKGENVETIS